MRQVVWVRLGVAAAVTAVVAAFVSGVGGRPAPPGGPKADPADLSFEARLVAADPAAGAELANRALFKRFKEKLPKVSIPAGGGGFAGLKAREFYLVEGDLALDEAQLLFYAEDRQAQVDRYLRAKAKGGRPPARPGDPIPSQLIGQLDPATGKFGGWKPGLELTYVVRKASFPGAQYDKVVGWAAAAAKNWNDAGANITFKHDQARDALPDGQLLVNGEPNGYKFVVHQANLQHLGRGTRALAFFPTQPKSQRVVFLDPSFFDFNLNQPGVMTHELGHVLGFRHEHIRSGAPADCNKESLDGTVPLTDYDPSSVMHYCCGGGCSLQVSAQDRLGLVACYGTRAAGGFAAPSGGAGFVAGGAAASPGLPRGASLDVE